MVLAAGGGARLRPITDTVPKPMVPIGGRPLLAHTIERLARAGVSECVMNLHHLPDVVTEYFGDGAKWGMRIHYSHERRLLGTAGALRPIRHRFDETFFVIYGDNLSTCDFQRMLDRHRLSRAFATVAVFHREDVRASGVAELDENDHVVRFIEKPDPRETSSHLVNAGIMVLEPGVLDTIPSTGAPDFARDLLSVWIQDRRRVAGYRMSENERLWWIDTPADLAAVEREFALTHQQAAQ
ncbi:MAG TPA: nucleotidyltransferase family protein [Vicinamibacterales bacterium]|nr:nucleotidyltransferase family protein [Vicinamibacterales bacterium]